MSKIIHIGQYSLVNHNLIISKPIEVISETKITYNSGRFRKVQEGEVRHLSKNHYPYLEVYFVDEENPEERIREAFWAWFVATGESILNK